LSFAAGAYQLESYMSVDSDGCGWKAGSTSTLHVHSISSMLYFLHWPQCGFTLSQRTLRL